MIRVVGVALLTVLAACTGERSPQKTMAASQPAVPVAVGSVVRRSVPVQVRAIGTVQPYSTVSVKAEVSGELVQVGFEEGQDVRKGDLLFTIDPRPFETAVRQAEANLAKDRAQAQHAQAEARRYEQLFQQGIIARQQYDQFRTNAEALEAVVRADQAAIENARLQLSYAKIYSPIDGRTGNLLVHRGNLVKGNDTQLVVINQIQPIYVSFSVPQQHLPEIKKYMAARSLPVQAASKEGGPPAAGRLSFIDNTIDVATGTILLKGVFANQSRTLWPGQFVDVVLDLATQPNAVLVPSEAVQAGQQGQFVFVVKADSTVESRPVVVSRTFEGESVVQSGLRPGETVVTDGQLRLAPGVKIRVRQ